MCFPVFGRVDSSNGSVFIGVDGVKGAVMPNAATLALFVGAPLIFFAWEAIDSSLPCGGAKLHPTGLPSLSTDIARDDPGFVLLLVAVFFYPFDSLPSDVVV